MQVVSFSKSLNLESDRGLRKEVFLEMETNGGGCVDSDIIQISNFLIAKESLSTHSGRGFREKVFLESVATTKR